MTSSSPLQSHIPEETARLLRERIRRFASSWYGGDRADDLVQEVFLVLLNKYSGVTALEELTKLSVRILSFKMKAFRVAQMRAQREASAQVDDLPLADGSRSTLEELLSSESVARIKTALDGLGERCRQLFLLKLQGLGFKEIQQRMAADALNTVYTWDHRCRRQLAELLQGDYLAGGMPR